MEVAPVDRAQWGVARWHGPIALSVTAIAVGMTLAGWSLSPLTALIVAVVAVALGMPHGALDVTIGPRLMSWYWFFPAYGLAAALTVAGWMAAPKYGLAIFVLLSWAHFGSGDMDGWHFVRWIAVARGAATGGLVLGLPLALHADVVAPIFTTLMLNRATFTASTSVAWGSAMLVVAVPAGAVACATHLVTEQWAGVGELVLLAMLGVYATPLLTFAVYFALWHSPRHLLASGVERRSVTPTVLATIATLGLGASAWVLIEPATTTAVRVVFIGLAALTVPHLAVTAVARRRHLTLSTPIPGRPDVVVLTLSGARRRLTPAA